MKPIISFLLIIFPISFISGPLIPEIILAIVSLYTNYFILRFKDFSYYKNKYSIFFLLLWIYLMINSIIISETSLWSLKSSFFYFRYYIFSISIIYLLDKKIVDLKKMGYWLSITFIVLAVDLLIQYFFGQNLIGLEPIEQNRNSSFFGHELILGSYLIKIFPIILAILVSKVIKLKNNSFTYIILPMFVVILLLTGERTASILGITFVMASSLYIIENFKLKIIYLFSLMIVPAILIVLNPDLNKRFFQDTYNYIKSSNYNTMININQKQSNYAQDEKIYIFSKLHHGHYLSAYNIFLEKPVLGNGVNTFRNECKKFNHKYNCSTHPHNFVLQILSEIGLFGLIFYLIVYFYFIYNFFKKNILGVKILSLGILIYFFPLSPSGNFFNNWLNMILYYIIGLYMYLKFYFNQLKNE